MELKRKNPFDVYPSVWEKIESLITKGLLLAPREVLNEITEGDDQLAKWAKEHNKMFVEPTEKQIEIVKNIDFSGQANMSKRILGDEDISILAEKISQKMNK